MKTEYAHASNKGFEQQDRRKRLKEALGEQGLVEQLILDHAKLRSVYREIRNECDRHERDNEFCLDTLDALRILFLAHSRAEEMALYNICETLHDEGTMSSRRELQDEALRGYVEHGLIERLFEVLGKFDDADDEWKANFVVLAELIERHLCEEEEIFFRKVKAKFHDGVLIDLGQIYLQEHEMILRKELANTGRVSARRRIREFLGVEHLAPPEAFTVS